MSTSVSVSDASPEEAAAAGAVAGGLGHEATPALEFACDVAEPQARWLETFWFTTLHRKHADVVASLQELLDGQRRVLVRSKADADAESFAATWQKAVATALKKVEMEDLGAMNAADLWETIPDTDDSGRGKCDLAALEKELQVRGRPDAAATSCTLPHARYTVPRRPAATHVQVKAVFCIGTAEAHGPKAHDHVFLVGAKPKLAKKCFKLRNLLSHYHWRLSGRDVAFESMTSKR